MEMGDVIIVPLPRVPIAAGGLQTPHLGGAGRILDFGFWILDFLLFQSAIRHPPSAIQLLLVL